MKLISRIIGAVLILLALAIFVLFKLNSMGFIKGSLGAWTTNVVNHLVGIKDDTSVFLHEEGFLESSPQVSSTPAPQQTTEPNDMVPIIYG